MYNNSSRRRRKKASAVANASLVSSDNGVPPLQYHQQLPDPSFTPRDQPTQQQNNENDGGTRNHTLESQRSPPQPQKVRNQHSLCVDILSAGYIDSFVDFFYLSNNTTTSTSKTTAVDDVDADDAANEQQHTQQEYDEIERLVFLKESLCDAECAQSQGDNEAVVNAYKRLADHFFKVSQQQQQQQDQQQRQQQQPPQTGPTTTVDDTTVTRKDPLDAGNMDVQTSVYFYQKCLDIAKHNNDDGKAAEAYLHLGLATATMGDDSVALAVEYLTKHLELTRAHADTDTIVEAMLKLIPVYRRLAQVHESRAEWPDAIKAYDQCVKFASSAGNAVEEGLVMYRMGLMYVKLNEVSKAIECHKHYLDVCRQMDDTVGEGQACAALAQCYRELGHNDTVIQYLENCVELSKSCNDQVGAEADACFGLGEIYASDGNYECAVKHFDKAYRLVKEHNLDRNLVDKARINLGMARGCLDMSRYMDIVNTDMGKLLKWKLT